MVLKMFTVYDAKAEAYLPPMFLTTKGLATRSFAAAVNDKGHDFNKYATDYSLYEIGEYDDSKGIVTMHAERMPLGSANEYLEDRRSPTIGGEVLQLNKSEGE